MNAINAPIMDRQYQHTPSSMSHGLRGSQQSRQMMRRRLDIFPSISLSLFIHDTVLLILLRIKDHLVSLIHRRFPENHVLVLHRCSRNIQILPVSRNAFVHLIVAVVMEILAMEILLDEVRVQERKL